MFISCVYLTQQIKTKIMKVKLNNEDLKEFKSFIILKDFLSQFDYCVYKKRKMKGGFEIIKKESLLWQKNTKDLLRFESYFRSSCVLKLEGNFLIIDEYALRLKQ
jgi:hypothetical protein